MIKIQMLISKPFFIYKISYLNNSGTKKNIAKKIDEMFNDDMEDLDQFYNNYSKAPKSNNKIAPPQAQSQKVLANPSIPKNDFPYNSQAQLNSFAEPNNYTSIQVNNNDQLPVERPKRSPKKYNDDAHNDTEYMVYRTLDTSIFIYLKNFR